MTRSLKASGLTALALFAMMAMVAPAAQAEVTLTSGSTAPLTHTATTVHGMAISPTGSITDNVYTTKIGAFHCDESLSTGAGTTTGTDKTLTITPSFTHCTTITSGDKPGTPLTVTLNGCHYLVNQPMTIQDGSGRYTGSASLLCPAGKKVEVVVYAAGTVTAHSIKICTISISETKNGQHLIYQNETGGTHDVIAVVAEGTTPYVSSGLCGVSESFAIYHGQGVLTSANHDLWLSD